MKQSNLNYFNYFTEIESIFIQKRGKHILLSPLDWMLIETWKDLNVPLHVAIRGIERTVELFKEKESRHKYINSLYYCNQSVLEEHEKYLLSMEGEQEVAPETEISPGDSDDESMEMLDRARDALSRFREEIIAFGQTYATPLVAETVERIDSRLSHILTEMSMDKELDKLEKDLSSLDDILIPCLEACLADEERQEILKNCRRELKHHRKNLPREMYVKILGNFNRKKIKEHFRISDLSLLERH